MCFPFRKCWDWCLYRLQASMDFLFRISTNHNKKPDPRATASSHLLDHGNEDSQSSHWQQDSNLEQKSFNYNPVTGVTDPVSKVKGQHGKTPLNNGTKDAAQSLAEACGPGPSPPPPPPRLPANKPPPVSDHENLIKLKRFHWDKVSTDPSQSIIWHRTKIGSFVLNVDEFEILFKANPAKKLGRLGVAPAKKKGIIDAKKAQNIAIQLRNSNIATQDICDALLQGDGLKGELLDILVKMSPTTEEQKALLDYSGDRSELSPAEQFLQAVLGIPNAFQRLQAMHYKASFRDELLQVRETLQMLEAACIQVRENRLILKLLEAVLKIGNRMNKGTNHGEAEAFKLDALLNLVDVKSADGKTTLLHFVTEQIIKSEGQKALQPNDEQGSSPGAEGQKLENYVKRRGLEIVIELCSELESVKKAAGVDADALSQAVLKLQNGLRRIENTLETSFQVKAQATDTFSAEDVFASSMETFCSEAKYDVVKAKEDLENVFDKVKKATAYFYGNAKETQPLRLFVIITDFSHMLEKVCRDLAKPLKMKIHR